MATIGNEALEKNTLRYVGLRLHNALSAQQLAVSNSWLPQLWHSHMLSCTQITCKGELRSLRRFVQLQVKMVTADDDSTTEIVVEGDTEEVTRMSKELQLVEKGKVYVKGILES